MLQALGSPIPKQGQMHGANCKSNAGVYQGWCCPFPLSERLDHSLNSSLPSLWLRFSLWARTPQRQQPKATLHPFPSHSPSPSIFCDVIFFSTSLRQPFFNGISLPAAKWMLRSMETVKHCSNVPCGCAVSSHYWYSSIRLYAVNSLSTCL